MSKHTGEVIGRVMFIISMLLVAAICAGLLAAIGAN